MNQPKTKILIVEDSKLSRLMLKMKLVLHNFTILEATNGEEAIEVFDSCKGAIDIVITDHHMPKK